MQEFNESLISLAETDALIVEGMAHGDRWLVIRLLDLIPIIFVEVMGGDGEDKVRRDVSWQFSPVGIVVASIKIKLLFQKRGIID